MTEHLDDAVTELQKANAGLKVSVGLMEDLRHQLRGIRHTLDEAAVDISKSHVIGGSLGAGYEHKAGAQMDQLRTQCAAATTTGSDIRTSLHDAEHNAATARESLQRADLRDVDRRAVELISTRLDRLDTLFELATPAMESATNHLVAMRNIAAQHSHPDRSASSSIGFDQGISVATDALARIETQVDHTNRVLDRGGPDLRLSLAEAGGIAAAASRRLGRQRHDTNRPVSASQPPHR